MEIRTTIVGNLTEAPELRFTPSGVAVAKFTIAFTPRKRNGDQWEDGEPTFLPTTVWRQLAEHCAESLAKGTRVIATGRLRTERWDDEKSGQKRSRIVFDAEAIGPELSYATAAVRKMVRSQGDPDDPWNTASKTRPTSPAPAGPAAEEPFTDEPPF